MVSRYKKAALVSATLLAIASSTRAIDAADEILNAFGSWRIERVEENQSYQLVGVSVQGTVIYFRVTCFPGQNHITLLLPFPVDFKTTDREITIVAWSDRPESATLKFPVLNGAAAMSIIGTIPSGENRYGESGADFLRIMVRAPKAFSYSIGPFSMTHDTFHLHAALQRFRELCGPTPVPLIPSP